MDSRLRNGLSWPMAASVALSSEWLVRDSQEVSDFVTETRESLPSSS